MRAYIVDFGLATVTDTGSETTLIESTGSATTLTGSKIIGTSRWLAPELFSQAGHTYATDIYAFALVCYEASYIRLHFGNSV